MAPSRPREPLPTRIRDLPPLTTAATEALERGFRALALDPTDEVRGRLEGHLRLLLAWTPAVNLTSIRDPADAALLHVIDSLTAVRLVRGSGADRLLDLGSGGGYPGLPLAIACPAHALLVESVGKKARFLETAIEAIEARPAVEVAAERAETLARRPVHRERWPLVTARAVAGLAELVELAFPLLERGGALIAWKRAPLDAELAAARHAAKALGGGRIRLERPVRGTLAGGPLAGHVLVVVEKRGSTAGTYPRDPAARDRHPW
jgi:16S rRNA (guanine527-N7)-methyltransferase